MQDVICNWGQVEPAQQDYCLCPGASGLMEASQSLVQSTLVGRVGERNL